MGSGLVGIDTTRLESSLGLHIQIRPDPEGTVPEKRGLSLFYLPPAPKSENECDQKNQYQVHVGHKIKDSFVAGAFFFCVFRN